MSGDLAVEVPRALEHATRAAFGDNVQRHSPDDLGDSPLMFGQAVTTNARHLAADAIDPLPGARVLEHGRLWTVELVQPDVPVQLYLYKAPPAAMSIEGLLLKSRTLRTTLLTANPNQLQIPLDGDPHPAPRHLIVAMFGDAIYGFDHLEVGEPVLEALSTTGRHRLSWLWQERLVAGDYGGRVQRPVARKDDLDDDLEVTLRVVPDVEVGR